MKYNSIWFYKGFLIAILFIKTISVQVGNCLKTGSQNIQHFHLKTVRKVHQPAYITVGRTGYLFKVEQKAKVLSSPVIQVRRLQMDLPLKHTGIVTVSQNWLFKSISFFFSVSLLGVGYLLFRNEVQARKLCALQREMKEKDEGLEKAGEKQDWLIKEIHHRVKNNLQIIMSLLNTQSSFLKNEEAIKAIRNCEHRMFAISLIHQKLYQTENLSNVDMVAYTHELLKYLRDEYDNESISFNVNMVPLDLNVDLAVPFGLILNEAITNILKFAFPDKLTGEVHINLQEDPLSHYILQITDNGIGLGHHRRNAGSNSFGKNLIAGLTRQLGGNYTVEDYHGVRIEIKFDVKPEPNLT